MNDREALDALFEAEEFEAVFHFASLKSVVESTLNPLPYYAVNVGGTIALLSAMKKFGCKKLIYASSGSVYGNLGSERITEEDTLCPGTPLAWSKVQSEKIIADFSETDESFEACVLRYFNPVGAHESGLIGELTSDSSYNGNIMPCIDQVAVGNVPILKVFGNDFHTPDGTGMRDYLHIMDLVEGNLAALNALKPGLSIYNFGTGIGTTVLELIKCYEMTSEQDIPYEIVERSPADEDIVNADASKAEEELGWKAQRDILHM
jgi:UDP-glucose 4-epimerase